MRRRRSRRPSRPRWRRDRAVAMMNPHRRRGNRFLTRSSRSDDGGDARRRHCPVMAPARTPEHARLEQARRGEAAWKAWGPYLSERQWGTVREDYSANGDAWNYFTHDHARSRAYRWGEDGIAGICDDHQRLCLALALWNGADPILKERMFGLSNGEGNHGEDVKEYWFYLDSTPTHSYLRCQYKYPQRAFPYEDLVATNGRRGKQEMEYELLDTGIFDENRYFDVVVEYAKAGHDDILMLVTAYNRGPEAATLHLLPTLWFRNTWSWGAEVTKPSLEALAPDPSLAAARVAHPELGRVAAAGRRRPPSCCSARTRPTTSACSERRTPRRTSRTGSTTSSSRAEPTPSTMTGPAPRSRRTTCSSSAPARAARSASACRRRARSPGPEQAAGPEVRSRLRRSPRRGRRVLRDADPADAGPDAAMVMRQALAGLLWSKQYYEYDVHRWLREHGANPWDPARADQLGPQRAVVSHDRPRRHLDARQVGVPVVRGLGPGVPRGAAVTGRRRLRQGAGRAAAAEPATCTPTARSRPTSGTSVTSTRRSLRGRRCSSTSARPRSAARATGSSWHASSSGC